MAKYTVSNAGQQQAEMTKAVKKELTDSRARLLIATVGEITGAKQAHDLDQDGPAVSQVDLIIAGKYF